jgi:hypothetical protein
VWKKVVPLAFWGAQSDPESHLGKKITHLDHIPPPDHGHHADVEKNKEKNKIQVLVSDGWVCRVDKLLAAATDFLNRYERAPTSTCVRMSVQLAGVWTGILAM